MIARIFQPTAFVLSFGILVAAAGCGGGEAAAPSAEGDGTQTAAGDQTSESQQPRFTPLDVNAGTDGSGSSKPKLTGAARTAAVRKKLDPFVRMIGKWNGTIQNKAGVEQVVWEYDVSTDESNPALKLKTTKGAYLEEGRLTWLPEEEKYQFTAVESGGKKLEFLGDFSVEPHDVLDGTDAKKVQRAFKLELTRQDDEADHKLAKVVFNQQDNGRYLFELYDKRRRFDTINTMREGRTFGISEDYGDKECIISQGLGTISIDYKGKTYWVCCSGCQKEFNAEPEKWIAKYKAQKAMEE